MLSTVAHICNPSTLGGWGGRITWTQEMETSLGNTVIPCLHKKFKNELGIVARACSPSYSGNWGERITWAQEVEVAGRQHRTTTLQPGRQNETLSQNKIFLNRLDTVAHACHPSTLRGWGRWSFEDQPDQHGETPSLLKIQNLAGHGGAWL